MSALASRNVVQASAVRPSMKAFAPRVAVSRMSLRVVAQAQNEKVRDPDSYPIIYCRSTRIVTSGAGFQFMITYRFFSVAWSLKKLA